LTPAAWRRDHTPTGVALGPTRRDGSPADEEDAAMRVLTACVTVLVVLAVLLALATAAANDVPRFQVDPSWPKTLPNQWIMGQASGVAVDDRDHVFVIQRPRSLTDDEKAATFSPPRTKCCLPAPPVMEFDPDGNLVRAWGGPGAGYDWPVNEHGINIDHRGFVWIGGNGPTDGHILKFTREGKFVMQIGKPGPQTDSKDVTRLGRPADVEVDPQTNEVYVADGYHNHRVIVFDAETGAYKRHWGAYGKPPTDDKLPPYTPAAAPAQQFGNPLHCVKISRDGFVYVCDRVNNRIQVFRKDGTFVTEMFVAKDTLANGSVWDLDFWIDSKQTFLFNADGANNEVRTLVRRTGEVVAAFGRHGRNAGEFHWVHNLAVDSKGNIYTTEVDTGKRAQKFRYVGPAVR
jgi:DNA-binding beta-propeller fold protein YncE